MEEAAKPHTLKDHGFVFPARHLSQKRKLWAKIQWSESWVKRSLTPSKEHKLSCLYFHTGNVTEASLSHASIWHLSSQSHISHLPSICLLLWWPITISSLITFEIINTANVTKIPQWRPAVSCLNLGLLNVTFPTITIFCCFLVKR